MKKAHLVLLLMNLALVLGFGTSFLARQNYEFVIYVGVIVFFMCVIGATLPKVDYTLSALIGLSIWSAMHLAGGGIYIGGVRLYDVMLMKLSARYPIFRYDQLVHVWGFGVATVVMYCLLRRPISRPGANPVAVGVVLLMAGLGVGALNEVVEFAVSVCVPESGVGGYINTSLDLCANLLGAFLGLIYIRLLYSRHP